ncbi:MAG: hypothetical protein SAK29_35240 [Scytonema sp. PMC 1069.18]|nr:hypothetical protein [Scytonema sp. PMC 1069.18]MEC4885091.1 hypothetical protein [Scytonema sp. PMC 1070.18]
MTDFSSNVINRVMEAISASREVSDRQLSALAATVERTSQNVDRTLEGIQQTTDRIERHVNDTVLGMRESADRIEIQVGLMSEHLTAIDLKIERLGDKIDGLADRISELTSAVNGHLEVAKQQALNISELTKLVVAQTNTVTMLISRTS